MNNTVEDQTCQQSASIVQFQAPTTILEKLDRDMSDKRSIKECLRSKSIPCREVRGILSKDSQERITRSEMKLSYSFILTRYLSPLKSRTLEQKESGATCISRIATTIRFVQLLLEFDEEDEPAMGQANDKPAIVTPSLVLDTEIVKITSQLIRSIAGAVCSCLEQDFNEPASCDDGDHVEDMDLFNSSIVDFNATQLAFFVFGSLLRLNGYIQTRPFLLSPVWKGLCDISEAMKRSNLPLEIFNEAVNALSEFFSEGLNHIIDPFVADQRNAQGNISMASSNMNPTADLHSFRILNFLVSRLTTLLNLPCSGEASSYSIPPDTLEILIMLRGLSELGTTGPTTSEHCVDIETSQCHGSQLSSTMTDLQKASNQICQKAERCLNSWLASIKNDDAESGNLFQARIQDILSVQSFQKIKSKTENDCELLSIRAFAIGKVSVLLYILEQSINACAGLTEDEPLLWTEKRAETLLCTCENLLFSALPQLYRHSKCHHNHLYADKTIQLVSATVIICETSVSCISWDNFPGKRRFHSYLIQWLLLSCNQSKELKHLGIHDELLSQEFISIVFCIYVETLQRMQSEQIFLRLLTKLLFDKRTATELRRIISMLLRRLLKMDDQRQDDSTKIGLRQLLSQELNDFLKTNICLVNPEARKRKRGHHLLSAADIRAIFLALRSKESVNTTVDMVSAIDSVASGRRYAGKRHVLLLGLEVFARDSCHDSIRNIESFCKIWNNSGEKQANNLQYSEYLALLGTAVSQEACLISRRKGRHLPEKSIEKLCGLLSVLHGKQMLETEFGNFYPFVRLLFEAIDLVTVIGGSVTPQTSVTILRGLSAMIFNLLSSEFWAIRVYGVTAVIEFVSTIPSAHKDIVPRCFPPHAQQMVQSRLRKSLSRQPGMALFESNLKTSTTLVWNRKNTETLFSVQKAVVVPFGSYFLRMPTQEGRHALVIFPPGNESLEDVRCMMGLDDSDGDPSAKLQIVHNVKLVHERGCKLLLQQIKQP